MNALQKTVRFQTDIKALDEQGNVVGHYRMNLENSASLPQDMMYNLQRALDMAGREVILGLEAKDAPDPRRQPKQAFPTLGQVPRTDCRKDDPLCVLGDEGPIPVPEVTGQ